MKKSKSESSFNKPIDESKDLKLKDIKKREYKQTVKTSSFKWSCCIFSKSESEDKIDISGKPDFSKRRKR